MLESDDYDRAIRAKLPFCSQLVTAGHSMGGAQAELFSACANRGPPSGEQAARDRALVMVPWATPKPLTPFLAEEVPGIFLKNRFSGLCVDGVGAVQSSEASTVQASLCHDQRQLRQRWRIEDGRVISELSSLCMTVKDAFHEAFVIQEACRSSDGRATENQTWHLTVEGFLKSRSHDKCLNPDLKLTRCPHSDQIWDLSADGHLVNRLSGLCLDVAGAASVEGTGFLLQDCKEGHEGLASQQRWQVKEKLVRSLGSTSCNPARTSETGSLGLVIARCNETNQEQQWSLLPSGFLQHRKTRMCVNVDGTPGEGVGSSINLAPCEMEEVEAPGLWTLTPQGFLLNIGSDWLQINKCMSANLPSGGDTTLSLEICEFRSAQTWEFSESGLRSTVGSRTCITAGEVLHLSQCVQSKEQQWIFDGPQIKSSTGQCLTAKGPELSLSSCTSSAFQQWQQEDLKKKCPQRSGGRAVGLGHSQVVPSRT
ncbi:unnamed protein product [Durusdinium trenchii]|uniref:Ricin B lectin domain-containing protein n=1 Tax=Durusdinium trenchii TaxID=1381693 RepID=A0ABP0P9N4_9DINO